MDLFSQLKDETGLVGGMCLTLRGQKVGGKYGGGGNEKLKGEGWEELHVHASERQACQVG